MRGLSILFLVAGCEAGVPLVEDPGACPAVTSFSTEALAEVAPGSLLRIEMSEDTPLWVTCTLDSDPDEVHLLESPSAEVHALALTGVLANGSYRCDITPTDCAGAAPSTERVAIPAVWDLPELTLTRDESAEMSGVYTIFNDTDGYFGLSEAQVVIVDPDGRPRWSYPLGTGYVPDIDASVTVDGNIHMGGGWGLMEDSASNRGIFLTVDPSGQDIYRRDAPDFGIGFNHHSEPLDDGTYLSLTGSVDDLDGATWRGIGIERYDPDADQVIWSWESQALIDAGQVDTEPDHWSPWHANSVTWADDAEGPAVYVSLYRGQQLWRIDRDTGRRTWSLGDGGDFALVDTEGNPLPPAEWFFGQHDPDWTEDMRVLLYDNGDGRPGGSYSRVSEYQLDVVARTATLLWSWTEPAWFNPVVGDADYLDNGHVLITKGFMVDWSPTSSDRTAIVELDPTTQEVIWRLEWDDRTRVAYRGQRYDGCAVFANAKYCPAVAERIAELSANR